MVGVLKLNTLSGTKPIIWTLQDHPRHFYMEIHPPGEKNVSRKTFGTDRYNLLHKSFVSADFSLLQRSNTATNPSDKGELGSSA